MSSVKSQREPFFGLKLTIRQLLTFRRFMVGRITVLGVVASAFALSGCSGSSKGDLPEPTVNVLPVRVQVLREVTSFDQVRSYTGILSAKRSTELGFERAARLVSLSVDDGDEVALGQELGRLDTRRLETRQEDLNAQRDVAAAVLAELEAGPRKESIAAARAEVAALRSQAQLAQRTFQRNARLRRNNAIAQQVLDDTEFASKTAIARLDVAQKRLDELEAGTRSEQIDAQRARVNQLDAMLADLQVDRQDSILTAPFTGRVAARYVDEGTVVSAGQAIFKIVETASLEARIGLPAEVASRLQPGDSVMVDVDEYDLRARFVAVLPEVDLQTRTQEVVLEIEQNDKLAPGQVVRFEATQPVNSKGFWVPVSSLTPGQRGLWSVFALEADDQDFVVRKRPVESLHTDGDRVLVRGAIQAGDRIVADGVHRVVPGQIVRIDE